MVGIMDNVSLRQLLEDVQTGVVTADQAVLDADIALSAKSMLLNPNLVEEIREGRDLPLYSAEEANRAYTGEELP